MRWSHDFLYGRIVERDKTYDGRFIVAVNTTRIYCLPSCTARKPKSENVRFFEHERQAIAAGFRACLRCRPDFFYRGEDIDGDTYRSVVAALQISSDGLSDTRSLARAVAVSPTKLNDLVRLHGQTTPAALIRKSKIEHAMSRLIDSNDRISDIAYAAGFESESTFHRQFMQHTALSPGSYRALRDSTFFLLRLPERYRAADALAYHGRDSESKSETVRGNVLCKALALEGCPATLTIALANGEAACQVQSRMPMSPKAMASLHAMSLRMLGLSADPASFERQAARTEPFSELVAHRRGLRIPLTATSWEALAWAILGQQINLRFACTLRRALVDIVGTPVENGCVAHPGPEAVASLDQRDLRKRQFSASKARYLIGAAQAVVTEQLPLNSLTSESAKAALAKLTSIAGIGAWTANYVMMRGMGLVDCVPVGDSALGSALQKLHGLRDRPSLSETAQLMEPYAPYRSFATAHLWASVSDQ
jgi:AraC family transcriptional regulator, regulatory protein of adaptative response / DNA-3-methyladenine glycosylase II